MRGLDGSGEGGPPRTRVVGGDGASSLQREGVLAPGTQIEVHHHRGAGEDLVHPLGLETGVDDHVVLQVVVNGRSAGADGLGGADHPVLGLDVHEDLLRGILRLLGRARHHHGHGLTHEADLAGSQHRLLDGAEVRAVEQRPDGSHLPQVLGSEGSDPLGRLDGNDPAVGDRATDEPQEGGITGEVGYEPAVAGK